MALSPGTKNFWVQSLWCWAIGLGLGAWALWQGYWWVAIAGLLVSLGQFCYFLRQVKTQLLAAIPGEWPGEVTTIEDCPWLDREWLTQTSATLTSLGFQPLADYRIKNMPAFARCWQHLDYRCWAECSETYSLDGDRVGRQVVIISPLSDNWSVAHLDRAVLPLFDSFPVLWRHPRKLGVFCPDRSLGDLLEQHLQFRAKLMAKTGATLLTDLSWAAYVQYEEDGSHYRQQCMQRINLLLGMIRVTWFELRPPTAWLGDYVH